MQKTCAIVAVWCELQKRAKRTLNRRLSLVSRSIQAGLPAKESYGDGGDLLVWFSFLLVVLWHKAQGIFRSFTVLFAFYCILSTSSIPERGGHTNFRVANVHVKPESGSAIFFSYIDPETNVTDNAMTTHSGCPVYEGEKKIVTQWVRLGVDRSTTHNSFNTCKWLSGFQKRLWGGVLPRTFKKISNHFGFQHNYCSVGILKKEDGE